MNKISFQVKFDTKVDLKNEFNEFSKFWDKYFVNNMTTVLLNTLEYSRVMADKQVEHGLNSMKKENISDYYFDAFQQTAQCTTECIKNSIIYDIKKIENNIQEIDVAFSIDYFIPQNGKYCPSIETYVNRFMIGVMVENIEQLRLLSIRINNAETDRIVRLDNHFLDLLKQMKESLKIEWYFGN